VDDSHLALSLVTLGNPGRLTGGYLYHRRMAAAAPAHHVRFRFLSFPDRAFPLAAGAAPRVMRGAAAGADAVLLDSIAAAFAGPWLASRAIRVPLVAVLHQPPGGIDHGPVRTAVQARLDRLAYGRAALLIVASDHLAAGLVADGVDGRRIRVVPPGRDVAPVPDAAEVPDLRGGHGAAVLCVANWLPRKGILELLDAFADLPPSAAVLHLAGDDRADRRYAAAVRARLAGADLARRVVVHGPVSRERVAALYAGADVFALPAVREPYGTVWGEAMAAGLPVVGWRAENLLYLAEEGREAFMAPRGDVRKLGSALERLVADEALRERMGKAARRRAASRPTWTETADLFFAAIREAIARS
jgi:glycosyltransferase involved in cell wall biosynthesis